MRSVQIFNEKMFHLRRAAADGSLDTTFTSPSLSTRRNSIQSTTTKAPQRLLWGASTTLHVYPLVATAVNHNGHHLRRSHGGETAAEILRSLLAAARVDEDDEEDASDSRYGNNHGHRRDGGQEPRHKQQQLHGEDHKAPADLCLTVAVQCPVASKATGEQN